MGTLTRLEDVQQERVVLVEQPFAAAKLAIEQVVGVAEAHEASLPEAEILEALDRREAIAGEPVRRAERDDREDDGEKREHRRVRRRSHRQDIDTHDDKSTTAQINKPKRGPTTNSQHTNQTHTDFAHRASPVRR